MHEAALLSVWEAACGLSPQAQALVWLAMACPGSTPVDCTGLSVGERDRHLFALRRSLFGRRLTLLAACPACAERSEIELDLDALPLAAPPDASIPPRAITVSVDGEGCAELRLPTAGDLAALKAAPGAAAQMLAACVLACTDESGAPHPAGVPLPPGLHAAAEQALEAADPLAVLELALTCPACAATWEAPLDIALCLGVELEAWTSRLLCEVHELARAYGWREAEIVALGPQRRHAYLELVRA